MIEYGKVYPLAIVSKKTSKILNIPVVSRNKDLTSDTGIQHLSSVCPRYLFWEERLQEDQSSSRQLNDYMGKPTLLSTSYRELYTAVFFIFSASVLRPWGPNCSSTSDLQLSSKFILEVELLLNVYQHEVH